MHSYCLFKCLQEHVIVYRSNSYYLDIDIKDLEQVIVYALIMNYDDRFCQIVITVTLHSNLPKTEVSSLHDVKSKINFIFLDLFDLELNLSRTNG